MAPWLNGLPGWSKALISLTGGLIIGSFTYYLLTIRDKYKYVNDQLFSIVEEFKRSRRILILGLTGAGKTCILLKTRAKLERSSAFLDTRPTDGFNVCCLQLSNWTLNLWEVGGSEKNKSYWPEFMLGTDLLVFVVDCSNEKHVQESKREFLELLKHDRMRDIPVLILANKQDVPGAIGPHTIEKEFGCYKGTIQGHTVRTIGTQAPMHFPTHPSVWEAERLMYTLSLGSLSIANWFISVQESSSLCVLHYVFQRFFIADSCAERSPRTKHSK